MTLWSALVAGLHYLGVMGLAATLSIEILTLKGMVSESALARLTRVDLFYGLSALLVLVTGVARVIWFGKGAHYYLHNWIFQLKVGIFIVVGLWSILPTLRFIRWRKAFSDNAVLPQEEQFCAMRKVVFSELHLLAILPFLAALMARGFGYFGH